MRPLFPGSTPAAIERARTPQLRWQARATTSWWLRSWKIGAEQHSQSTPRHRREPTAGPVGYASSATGRDADRAPVRRLSDPLYVPAMGAAAYARHASGGNGGLSFRARTRNRCDAPPQVGQTNILGQFLGGHHRSLSPTRLSGGDRRFTRKGTDICVAHFHTGGLAADLLYPREEFL